MSLNDYIGNSEQNKQLLNALKRYAEDKIANRNKVSEAAPLPEMNLASQPVIASDHLGEESVLQPINNDELLAENINGESQGLDASQNFALEALGTESNAQVINPAPSTTEVKEEVPELTESLVTEAQGTYIQDTNSSIQVNSTEEPSAVSISTQGEGIVPPVVNNSVNDLSQGTEPLNQEPAVLQTQGLEPDVPSLKNTAINQASVSNGLTEDTQSSIEQNQLQSTGQNGMMNYNTPSEMSGEMNSTLTASSTISSQGNNIPNGVNDDGQIADMITIPEISIPETGIPAETTSYQASSNGSQAFIADVTPAMSDANVVMPTGLTPDVANDQTLVVGPESFTQSR